MIKVKKVANLVLKSVLYESMMDIIDDYHEDDLVEVNIDEVVSKR